MRECLHDTGTESGKLMMQERGGCLAASTVTD